MKLYKQKSVDYWNTKGIIFLPTENISNFKHQSMLRNEACDNDYWQMESSFQIYVTSSSVAIASVLLTSCKYQHLDMYNSYSITNAAD